MRIPRFLLLLAGLAAALLTGCTDDSDSAGEGALRSGHYLILTDRDDRYDYAQYFVVVPGSRWEFVEYGTSRPGNSVCQVTRSRGSYSVKDTSITVVLREGGESFEKCPMTQAEFNGYTWDVPPGAVSQVFQIRNLTDSTFEGRDMFLGAEGWKVYRRTRDPHGFFD